MQNNSGITPVGHRILIKPLETETKSASGIIIETDVTADRAKLAQIRGTVIEIGSTAYSDQPEAWCKVGDVVTFGKYSGLIYKGKDTLDEQEYRLVNDLDIVAIHKEA